MAMRAIHEYLADALIKEIGVFGKSIAAERIAKSLQLWETAYGSAIADKARKLITADWRTRFKARGSGLGTSHRGGGPDGPDQGSSQMQPDALVLAERDDAQPANHSRKVASQLNTGAASESPQRGGENSRTKPSGRAKSQAPGQRVQVEAPI